MRATMGLCYCPVLASTRHPARTTLEPQAHELRTRRTARYYTLGGGGQVRSAWYVLHGYRQLADRFIERFRHIADPARLVIAPEALNRCYLYGRNGRIVKDGVEQVAASWMTRHERAAEITDYVSYLDALDRSLRLPRGTNRVVLGFSQGSQTAARWIAFGRQRVSRLVMWGGVLPPDLDVAKHARVLRAVQPVLVRSEQDPSLPAERVDAELARLVALGIPATGLAHAGGHAIGRDALIALARVVDPGRLG